MFQNKSQAIAAEHRGPRDGMEKHFGEHSGGEDENQFVGRANGTEGELSGWIGGSSLSSSRLPTPPYTATHKPHTIIAFKRLHCYAIIIFLSPTGGQQFHSIAHLVIVLVGLLKRTVTRTRVFDGLVE